MTPDDVSAGARAEIERIDLALADLHSERDAADRLIAEMYARRELLAEVVVTFYDSDGNIVEYFRQVFPRSVR